VYFPSSSSSRQNDNALRNPSAGLGTWLMAAVLSLGALTGCKSADLYRPGYDNL
jgi:hypothetical protein